MFLNILDYLSFFPNIIFQSKYVGPLTWINYSAKLTLFSINEKRLNLEYNLGFFLKICKSSNIASVRIEQVKFFDECLDVLYQNLFLVPLL